jgi:ribonuclease-3
MTGSTISQKRLRELDKLLSDLGILCGRMALMEEALTHSSYAAENPGLTHNERLEFFGDSVLKFVISEYLLERFPNYDEGKLSEIRAVLVSGKTLAEVADKHKLGRYILTGRRVSLKPSILAGAMEAVLGAIYLDSGLMQVQNLIIRLFGAQATAVDRDEVKENFKAQLQEWTQSKGNGIPIYAVVETEGPAHDPLFTISVSVAGEPVGSGTGHSKKDAEQAAAKDALTKLGVSKTTKDAAG